MFAPWEFNILLSPSIQAEVAAGGSHDPGRKMSALVKSLKRTWQEDRRLLRPDILPVAHAGYGTDAKGRPEDVSAWAALLRKEGYVVIPTFIDRSTCELWLAEVRAFLRANGIDQQSSEGLREPLDLALPSGTRLTVRRSTNPRGGYDSGFIDCFNPHLSVPAIRAFVDHRVVAQIVAGAAGGPITIKHTNLYRNKGLSNPRAWHMDVWRTSNYKAFLYLTDVSCEGFGPYAYWPRSHRPSLRRYLSMAVNHLRGFPLGDLRFCRASTKGRVFLAPRGTLIISNQRGYHRGLPQGPDRERLLLVNHYVAKRLLE